MVSPSLSLLICKILASQNCRKERMNVLYKMLTVGSPYKLACVVFSNGKEMKAGTPSQQV